MKKISTVIFTLLFWICALHAQQVNTFEMRYLTSDAKADGVTDFHGETEWLDTEGRIAALNRYADFASSFWGDPELDTPLFTDQQVRERLYHIKPQPLTSIRRTIVLDSWRSYGYKTGKETSVAKMRQVWSDADAAVSSGALVLDGKSVAMQIDTIAWRFRMKFSTLAYPAGLNLVFSSLEGQEIKVWFEPGKVKAVSGKTYTANVGLQQYFEIYGDFQEDTFFISSDEGTLLEFPIDDHFPGNIAKVVFDASSSKVAFDALAFYSFDRDYENKDTPYSVRLVYDDDFDDVLPVHDWQCAGYDDSAWETVSLPSSHGAQNVAGESYYLRTKVNVDSFARAYLDIETLDPAGEVWVNGEPVAVLKGRVPRYLDITEYLAPDKENIIGVRVKPYLAEHVMHHGPSDHNIGWFLGRTKLILTDDTSRIAETLVHTLSLDETNALQHHRIIVKNDTGFSRKASLEVNYYPWFPAEGELAATITKDVELRPRVDNIFEVELGLDAPAVWSTDTPQLYKVQVVLKDENGVAIDDYVTTAGVRVIEQKDGVLYINHKPEMLNGAQNFGYRLPVETMARTIRCATDEMVMRDMMMSEALGGNLLRVHVHAEKDISDGINDPRYAEYADQMGLYLIWQSAGWLREGEAWNVEIEDWPLYMKQVYNHPSIVLWEASNHPNCFKKHDFNDTEDYFNSIITTLVATDTSRLVSPTSYWPHSYYANYDGTMDYLGNSHEANPVLMHKMMTRGSQDAYTGYGEKWSTLRKHPYDWAKSCLEAKGLCYFNFEHEESAAQPNWSLARKEPWYKLQSYEWPYEQGSIGRLLDFDQWRESQAFQAFSAWESMKIQTLAGVCGFSWCSLESGANMFTYQKPLVDPYYVPKLAFHANKMVFGRIWAASDDVDTVYGPGDEVRPVIFNLGDCCSATLVVELCNERGRVVERRTFRDVSVDAGRSVTRLEPFRFKTGREGCHFIVYRLSVRK